MKHQFEIKEGGADTLVLLYPPDEIRAFAERLNGIERLHGPLPEIMQVPVRGEYTASTRNCDSSSATAGSGAPSV